jgi:hypothetical protein
MLNIILYEKVYHVQFHTAIEPEEWRFRFMPNLSTLHGQEDEEAAIGALCQQLNESWGDAEAFAAFFAEDAG